MGNQAARGRSKSEAGDLGEMSGGGSEKLRRRSKGPPGGEDPSTPSAPKHELIPCSEVTDTPPYPVSLHQGSRFDGVDGITTKIQPLRQVDLRVFPSFDALNNGGEFRKSVAYTKDPVVNIKIYRHSGGARGGAGEGEESAGDRAAREALRRSTASVGVLPNGSAIKGRESGFALVRGLEGHGWGSGAGGQGWGSGGHGRALGSGGRGHSPPIMSRSVVSVDRVVRSSGGSTMRAVAPPLPLPSPSDFPPTPCVTRRLALFESHFVTSLLARYASLPSPATQASVLSVAIHLRSHPHRHVSLHRYLARRDVPCQLIEPDEENCGEYITTVPDALFHVLMHVRARRDRAAVEGDCDEGSKGLGGGECEGEGKRDGTEVRRAGDERKEDKRIEDKRTDYMTTGDKRETEDKRMDKRIEDKRTEDKRAGLEDDLDIALGREIVACIGAEAAAELSRIYEYQIGVMAEDTSIRLLAEHAVLCAVCDCVRTRSAWERNSLVRGVVRAVWEQEGARNRSAQNGVVDNAKEEGGESGHEGVRSKFISVIIGQRELKWDLHEVLRKPGLRRDRLLFSDIESATPLWDFHSSPASDSPVYGYRGPMLFWDYFAQAYALVAEDEKRFDTAPLPSTKDFHQLYRPYRVLIGTDVMRNYCAMTSRHEGGVILCDYVKRSGYAEGDAVIPVYRPLKALSLNSAALKRANFDGADLSRVHLMGADLSHVSARGVRLQHARLSGAQLGRPETWRDADVSYMSALDVTAPEGGGVVGLLGSVGAARYTMIGGGEAAGGVEGTDWGEWGREGAGGEGAGRVMEICDREGRLVKLEKVIEDIREQYNKTKEELVIIPQEVRDQASVEAIKKKDHKRTKQKASKLIHGPETNMTNGADKDRSFTKSQNFSEIGNFGQTKKCGRSTSAADIAGDFHPLAPIDDGVDDANITTPRLQSETVDSVDIKTTRRSREQRDKPGARLRDRSVTLERAVHEVGNIVEMVTDKVSKLKTKGKKISINKSKAKQGTSEKSPMLIDNKEETDKVVPGKEVRKLQDLPEQISNPVDDFFGRTSFVPVLNGVAEDSHKESKTVLMEDVPHRDHQMLGVSLQITDAYKDVSRVEKGPTHRLNDAVDARKTALGVEGERPTPLQVTGSVEVLNAGVKERPRSKSSGRVSTKDKREQFLAREPAINAAPPVPSCPWRQTTDELSSPNESFERSETTVDITPCLSEEEVEAKLQNLKQERILKSLPPEHTKVPVKEHKGGTKYVIDQSVSSPKTRKSRSKKLQQGVVRIKNSSRLKEPAYVVTSQTEQNQRSGNKPPGGAFTVDWVDSTVSTCPGPVFSPSNRVASLSSMGEDSPCNRMGATSSTATFPYGGPVEVSSGANSPCNRTDASSNEAISPYCRTAACAPASDSSLVVKYPSQTGAACISMKLKREAPTKIYRTNAGYLSDVHASMPLLTIEDAEGGGKDFEFRGAMSKVHVFKARSLQGVGALGESAEKGPGVLSQADVNNINTSQIVRIVTKELRVTVLVSQLPSLDSPFTGRSRESDDLSDLIGVNGRVVTVTGCHGLGKSSLALAVCRSASVTTIRVELRGCVTVEGALQRITNAFDLRFRMDERAHFYAWLNAHRQPLLLFLDNFDLVTAEERDNAGKFLDELVSSVRELRVLCTARVRVRCHGEVYRLGELRDKSIAAMLWARSRDAENVVEACAGMPLAARVLGGVLSLGAAEGVDAGGLVEELMSRPVQELNARVKRALDEICDDDFERQKVVKVAECILKVFNAMDGTWVRVLMKASVFAGYFDLDSIIAVVGESETKSAVERALSMLVLIGFVEKATNSDRCVLSPLIRCIASALLTDGGVPESIYTQLTMSKLGEAALRFHGRESFEALRAAQEINDSVSDVIWRAVEGERALKICGTLATFEGAVFLTEALSDNTYLALYEQIVREAVDDAGAKCRAAACLAYHHAVRGDANDSAASSRMAESLTRTQSLCDSDVAFAHYVMARAAWINGDQRRGLALSRRAYDSFKLAARISDPWTLYAGELHAWMLTHADNHQMARHWYNILDAPVREILHRHPLTIDGLDARRIIWDRAALYERACAAARNAVDTARAFYGIHPITATTLMNQSGAIAKRGHLHEAISAAAAGVAMRVSVLGDHLHTADAYRTLAELLLRSGQRQQAAGYARVGMGILDRVGGVGAGEGEARVGLARVVEQVAVRSSSRLSKDWPV